MPRTGLRPPAQLRRRHFVAVTVALAALFGAGIAPAVADAPLPPADPSARPSLVPPTPLGPVQAAQAKAKSSGGPVTVDGLTTQTSLTVANPDGSLSVTNNLLPARVQKNGAWTPLDATLTKNSDGTYSPAATPSAVALSGGGSGPLATLTDPAGHQLALTMPFTLPTPTVTGGSAQYADVLPGVDLNATVSGQGAFREVLIVHNATAAANPQLKTLRLATSSNGLTTTADQSGNVTVQAADGTAAFTAPTPVMWDSTAAPTALAAAAAAAPRAVRALIAPQSTPAPSTAPAPVDSTGAPTSSDAGPGTAAHVTAIAVQADNSALTLTPDATQLSGTGTTWPLYIDPAVTPATGVNHYTEAQETCSNSLYDKPQLNGEGVGYQLWGPDCIGLYRTFYEFNTSNLTANMVISKSTLYFALTYGADSTCTDPWPLTLALTGAIASSTNWPGPGIVSNVSSQNVSRTGSSGNCNQPTVNFDVTSTVKQWQTNGNLTFGLYGNENKSAGNYGFMRFNPNPYIVTSYDIAPNTPDSLYTSPAAQNPGNTGCNGTAPGWIGMTTLNNNTSNITLHAYDSSPISGTNLTVGFHVWDNMANNGHGSPADTSWPNSPTISNWSWAQANIGAQVSDGHQYGWNAWGNDGTLGSGSSGYCYFNVDLTPPTMATFGTSTAFPALGSGLTPTAHAGDSGITIPVSSTDPTPTGCTLNACIKSGVQSFQYSLDSNIPVVGFNSQPATTDANGNATANIPINLSTTQWGTHTLYVRAVDGAGNTQPTAATYSFYAPWNPATKVTAGDLTGDGIPDLLATASDDNLYLIPGNTDTAATPSLASSAVQAPNKDGWSNYLIAHRGSESGGTTDDLFAFNKKTNQMYLYRNDSIKSGSAPVGSSSTFTNPAGVVPISIKPPCASATCTGYNTNDWSSVTQMIAPGGFSTPGKADLITVEGGNLWYYTGNPAVGVDTAYLIGTGNWSNTTLIAPGAVTGTAGTTPTLWARDNTTGAITSYPLTFDASGTPTSSLTAPTDAPLTSGVLNASSHNMCAEIRNAATTDGTAAQLNTCNGSNAQQFTLGTDNTDNTKSTNNSVHVLGKCLDIAGGATGNGSPVDLLTCNSGPSQQWVPGPFPGALQNPASKRCLADPSASNTPGTQLIIWDCLTGHAEQNWAAATVNSTLPAAQLTLPVGIGVQDSPTIASPGDVHGTGNPDIYTISANGKITEYPGATPVNGIAQLQTPLTLGYLDQATDRWKLADTSDSVNAANPLTLTGSAAFTNDATRATVLSLPGTAGSSATTAGPVLDTTKSYSVSAWAYLTNTNGYANIVGQSGNNASAFYLSYSPLWNAWTFISPSSDSASPSSYPAVHTSTPPATNHWTHLVATYDATSQTMSLYVNGTLIGTAPNTTPWAAGGPLTIGNAKNQNPFPGMISDVQTFNTALSPAGVAALNNTQPSPRQLS